VTGADEDGRSSYLEAPSTPEPFINVPACWSTPEEDRKFSGICEATRC
jgi:hypothetical protein